VASADQLRRQQILQRRFQAMGLEAGLLAGGRSVLATLQVGPEPFATPVGPRALRAVRFFTVGHDRIKCVAPLALFHLPLVRILDCETAAHLEARIRAAWNERLRTLTRTRHWLDELGVAVESPSGAPLWSFALGLEDPRARGAAIEPARVLLPSRGPLSGMALARAEDRVFQVDTACTSAVDLELAVTARLETLARSRRQPPAARPDADLPAPRVVRLVPALVVGARIAADRPLHDALRRRGFVVETARSAGDAVAAFRERTFEVVLAESRLDRGDGIELVPALRSLPGILELPVALIDDRPREARRNAAGAAGAAAYWAGPLEPTDAAEALADVAATDRRRFARYDRALAVSWPGCGAPGVTASVGRGGIFLKTPTAALGRQRFALHLPDSGTTLAVDADPIYRLPAGALGPDGFGLRFCGFEAGGERAWIDYVAAVATAPEPLHA
jgi:two-component system, chemotaxis family, chemotaxis protein CheY